MESFNHFRIKRQARSRQGNETWNPFQHVSWKPDRAETWNGGRLEAQVEGDGQDEDIAHASTSPYPRSGNVRDISTSGSEQGTEDPHGKQQCEDSHDIPLIDRSQQALRNRKGEQDDALNEIPVDEPGTSRVERPRRDGLFQLVYPKEPFTIGNQLQRIFWINWLSPFLPLVPAGIALQLTRGNSIETFIVNFLAMFPLANMSNLAIDEIQLRLGTVYGNLLNTTTSNLFQLISCILLLVNKQIIILQTTLIGGILANILLVLGLSFVAGGLRRPQQFYNITTTHVLSNLLSLSATSLLIPTASKLLGQTSESGLAKQPRGASFILITVYLLFLEYQLKTHWNVFLQKSEKVPAIPWGKSLDLENKKAQELRVELFEDAKKQRLAASSQTDEKLYHEVQKRPINQRIKPLPSLKQGLASSAQLGANIIDTNSVAMLLFIVSNVALFFIADYAVNSINELATTVQLSRTFIGLILLPIPNCDPYTIYLAVEDEVDQVITNTIGRCIQTALCITPSIILLAWWLDIEGVTLVFDGFEIVSLFAAILLLNFVVSPGKDHWIQGVLLLADWALIAIAAYFVDLGPYGSIPMTS
ncbi:Ca2+ transporter [Trichoderma chlorosporum]